MALGVALAPAGAIGAPVWSTPITVDSSSAQPGEPRIAVNAGGLTVIAWTRALNGVRVVSTATRASGASAFGAGAVVSPAGSSAVDPQVVVNNSGVTLITWNRSDGGQQVVEYAARATSTGSFVTGSLGPGTNARPALDGNGNAVVVWTTPSTNTVVRAAVRRNDLWQASGDLSAADRFASAPRVVATPFGDVAAVWLSRAAPPASANRVVQAARILLPGSGTWSAATSVSPAGEDAKDVEVGAAGQNGTALAVWASSGGSPSSNRVRVGRSVIATGAWTTPSPVASGSGQVFTPSIDVAPDGRAVIAYPSGTNPTAVFAGAGTTTSPSFPLRPAGDGLSPVVSWRIGVAANRADATIVAGSSGQGRRTRAGVRRSHGRWLTGVTLSQGLSGTLGAESGHRLGRDAAGGVTAIWMTQTVEFLGVFQQLRVATLGEQDFTCLDQEAHIVGTSLADFITGTDQNDVIASRNGNDIVNGLAGSDRICLGNGDDTANGGDGNDQISGGAGNDEIYGNAGSDILTGGLGNDQLFGGPGTDQLLGGSGNDELFGGSGNDQLFGGVGADTGNGGTGSDFCANDIEVKISCP